MLEIAISLVGLALGALGAILAYMWRTNGRYMRELQNGHKEIINGLREIANGQKEIANGQREIVKGIERIAQISKAQIACSLLMLRIVGLDDYLGKEKAREVIENFAKLLEE